MVLFSNAANADESSLGDAPDQELLYGPRRFAPGAFGSNLLGGWWRWRSGGKLGTPYELLRPVSPESAPPAAAPAAVPPPPVPQLLGRFTTRRTQLFGPFANLL